MYLNRKRLMIIRDALAYRRHKDDMPLNLGAEYQEIEADITNLLENETSIVVVAEKEGE